MYILGISAYYHDSAAALIKDGVIIAAAQEERFTRKKHDHKFPKNAIKYCLDYAGINANDLSYVAFYDKPMLKFERLLETYTSLAPKGFSSFIKAMPLWIKEKIWMKDLIKNELNYNGIILFPEHHQSHAASAFFASPFNEAAFLTIDGVGEWTTTSYGIGEQNKIEIMADIKFPHSLGLLYSAFTYYTGFKVNSGEYKVMGLAPYGEPKYVDIILNELIDLKEDGSFKMNMKYFDFAGGLKMTNDAFNKLFGGKPREPESKLTQREMDFARSIQDVTEIIMIRMAKHIKQVTGKKYLCLAGGVALNCVANGKILREGIFDDIWIQPAAGDAGGALGAALFVWYQYLNNKRISDNKNDKMFGAYLGTEFNNEQIKEFLDKHNIKHTYLETADLHNKIADILSEEKILGILNGRMEFGPRALGARSIIGDARSKKMQSVMNLKIKFRESFRPFAPSVMEERISDYFEIDRPSPYMLLVADVKKERQLKMSEEEQKLFGIDKLNIVRSDIPAVTHIDYSARIQSVNKNTNPFYHGIISTFNEKYGYGVIVNTSFNVRGEPIVNSPEDAYRCFMRTDIDYLVLGNYLLNKTEMKKLINDTDWKKEFELD
ncbi:MAG TPA: carbamoyltransferase [Melioribacteraceae bacterium]|nr:carbamoyltransferase [Melioribacteraceae bacterium]